MIAKEDFEDNSYSSTEDLPVIWPAILHDNNCSTEACSNDETSLVQSDKYCQANVTTSGDYSSDRTQQQRNEQEERNRYRLYLLVLRCIAYPFNIYTQSVPTVLPMRLTKSLYRAICDKAATCITDPETEKNFCFCLKWYYKSILNRQDVVTRATSGELSLRELRYVFKVHAHRHLCRVNSDTSDSIEETLHSWLSQFDVLFKVDSHEWFSRRRASTLPRTDGFIKSPGSRTTMNPDSFYRMFQEILGISPIEHHAIITEYQINSREEQEATLKRELKERIEKASQPNAFADMDFFSSGSRELFCAELVTRLKKLLKKADMSLSLTRSISHSQCHIRRKKKVNLRAILSEVSSESGEDTVVKAKFSMKFQLKVIIHEAVDINGVSEGQAVYCEFQLAGASHQPLVTDEAILSEDGRARFDTEGTFETASPVPVLKLQLKLASKGIFKNDKLLGKVVINPCPSTCNVTEVIDMVSPDQKQGPKLRVTINMKMPSSMKRCGFLYAQGDYIFQQWKKRFFALVYHHKYLLCCYAVNGTNPKKILPLEGYTVDYSEATSITQGHDDGQAQFVMVKEASKVHFGVKGSNERLGWLQSLTRATGQSYKPCPPDSIPNSEGGSSLLMLDQLRQFTNDSISDSTHHDLFAKLYHVMLNYRMKESVFSRGLFSPAQNYVLEEYCQRYGIRSVFLHLITLSELVTREWAGQSCDPVMMLSSFSYCRMAVSGKMQDHLSAVTSQDNEMFQELCGKIKKLVHYKIEHFRSCFPFACPKSDLAITLKLFCSVTEVMLADDASCDHAVIDGVDNLLRKAALHSYQDLLHLLSTAEDDDKSLTTPQLIALAELSVEYMCELHDFFLPDFAQFSLPFKSHVEAFWSFLEVDITTSLKELFLADISSGEILKVFYTLNQYCLAQNLTLSDEFLFHKKLQQLFLPVVVQYLTKLDSDINRDLRLLFSKEKWSSQQRPCVPTIAACLEALYSIQQMIQELRWPDKDVGCHLQQRCLTICSEQLRYCTNTTMAHLESVIGDTTPHTFDMRLPQQAFSMLCSLCHLQEQATKLLKSIDPEMVGYHGDINLVMQAACETAVSKISEKASLPLKLLLQRLSQYDASGRLSKFKKLFYFSSIPVEDYVQCMSLMLEDIVQYCYKYKVQQMLLQKWFELHCSLVQAWLKQRPDCSLCPDQYQTISIIMKTPFPQDLKDCMHSRLLSGGLMKDQLGDLTVYNLIGDRVRMECSCSELINKN